MPSPGSYTDVFGNTLVFPAQPSFLSLALSTNIVLGWPLEKSPAGTTVAADLIEVTPSGGGLTIQLSDATQVSQGYYAIFNNLGASSFNVLNNGGGVIATVASGTVWYLYLADNTTVNGTWRSFQFGAGTSSATAAALAGAGLIALTTTLNQNYALNVQNVNYVAVLGDRAKLIEWTGGAGTLTLPNSATIPAGWFCMVKNSGTGIWTVSVTGGQLIDGVATLALNLEQSCFLIFDGTNFVTLGLGQALNSIFDFIQISLTPPGTGTIILSGVQLNRISYRFTGALTGNVTVQVPSTVQQYWVDNETTGAFTLTVATGAGGGALTTAVTQGQRNILYCDGTNVVPAVTFGATGFVNGAVAAPSIFFAASPHTGFYSPAADQVALTTASTQRLLVDATGHFIVQTPDTSGVGTFTTVINGPVPSGTALEVVQQLQSASSPAMAVVASGSGGGAFLGVAAQTAVIGTSELSIFQLGTTNNATIINRASGANLSLSATGAGNVLITSGGPTVASFSNVGANSVILGSSAAYSIGLINTTSTTVGAAGGAAALPAQPSGYLTINVNGGNSKIPYYNP